MSTDHPDIPLEQAHVDRAAAALEATKERERDVLSRPREGGSMRMADRARREHAERRLNRLLDARDGICFGRIDGRDDRGWHVGLNSIYQGPELLVISFESEVGGKFADASIDDPQGLKRRRRFNVVDGTQILSLRDEMLDGSEGEPGDVHDAILEALERERSSEMRHIAATIEREQNRLIRFERSGVLVVQGAPGTGKTAVALHRASWLAFTFDRTLGGSNGILVVGPNPTFMDYVKSVLPGLGKRLVTQLAVGSLGETRARAKDDPEAAALKGDARMAEVVRRAALSRISVPGEDTTIRFDLTDVVISAAEVEAIVRRAKGRRRPYMEGRQELRRLLGELFRERYGNAVGRRAARRTRCRQPLSQPAVRPVVQLPSARVARVVRRAARPRALHRRAPSQGRTERLLDEREATLLARPDVKIPGDHRWTAADAVLIDEADFVLRGRRGGWRYVIVDEAQDLTPMQLRMVGRRSSTGDLTLVGDLAQATGPCRHDNWHAILAHIGSSKEATIRELSTGYRVPAEILDYASRLLPEIAPDLQPATSIRSKEDPWIEEVPGDVEWWVAPAAEELIDDESGTIGIIAPKSHLRRLRDALSEEGIAFGSATTGLKKRLTLLAADQAKGLEFDHVVVVEPSAIVAEGVRGLGELYVALTRATQTLTVYHADALPSALG